MVKEQQKSSNSLEIPFEIINTLNKYQKMVIFNMLKSELLTIPDMLVEDFINSRTVPRKIYSILKLNFQGKFISEITEKEFTMKKNAGKKAWSEFTQLRDQYLKPNKEIKQTLNYTPSFSFQSMTTSATL